MQNDSVEPRTPDWKYSFQLYLSAISHRHANAYDCDLALVFNFNRL